MVKHSFVFDILLREYFLFFFLSVHSVRIDLTAYVGIRCQLYSLFDSKIHDCASSPVELFTSGVLGYELGITSALPLSVL